MTTIEMHDEVRMLLCDIEDGFAMVRLWPGQIPPIRGNHATISYQVLDDRSRSWRIDVTQRGGIWYRLDLVSMAADVLDWDDMPPDLQDYAPPRAQQRTIWGFTNKGPGYGAAELWPDVRQ